MEYGLALYNLGYTDFKQKNYPSALNWFNRFLAEGTHPNRQVLADAYNRIGDCHFYARNFEGARQSYDKAGQADPTFRDYSLYQEAFVKGLQRDYAGKVQTLNVLITNYPQSQYLDDALYEQGRAYMDAELFNGEYYQQKVDVSDKSVLDPYIKGDTLTGNSTVGAYWNEEAGQLKYQIDGGCIIDQVLGQWMCEIAGVGEIIMVSPPSMGGKINPVILAASPSNLERKLACSILWIAWSNPFSRSYTTRPARRVPR